MVDSCWCDQITRRISRPYLVPSGTCFRPSDGCRKAECDPHHVVHYKHGLEPTVKSCLTISCNRGGERFVNRPTRLTRGHSSLGSKTQLGLPSPRESIIADQLQNVNRSMKKCNRLRSSCAPVRPLKYFFPAPGNKKFTFRYLFRGPRG